MHKVYLMATVIVMFSETYASDREEISIRRTRTWVSEVPKDERGNWTRVFTLTDNLEVTHTPDAIYLGEFKVPGYKVNLTSQVLGNLVIKGNLILSVNSTEQEFIQGLKNAGFEVDPQ